MSSFRRGPWIVAAALFVSGLFAACDKKKDETAAAPTPSGMPPLDQPVAAAPPSDHPTHAPAEAAPNLPPGHPALPPGHPPMGPADVMAQQKAGEAPQPSGTFAGATPGGEFDPKTVLEGTIKLDGKLKDKVAAGDTIFLVARKYEEGATTQQGTPLAVRKLTVDKFPIKFSLDSRDAMLAGTQLAGKVVVTARVDKDGDAITKNPGDVIGQSKPIEPPKKDVVVSLDKVL